MRHTRFAVLTVALGIVGTSASGKGIAPARTCLSSVVPDGQAPVVQLAILLDTSNSMDGLIDQARAQLWEIVNQFTRARRGGQPVELQVALYEYGNARLSPESGWVRRVLPFTTDLDRVSEALFALETNGGDEFCGTVIQAALDQLQWGTRAGDLRVIFIAGNEPFTQGPVGFRSAVRRAATRGIVVNTIHCGSQEEGQATGWREGALLARGAFSTIDQARALVHVEAPQDAELARLGVELNKTYVPYGAEGIAGQNRQELQDTNALSWKGSAVNRAVSKANLHYRNSRWDLVDAVNHKEIDLLKLKAEQLPEHLRGLPVSSLQQVLLDKASERKRIQDEINRLYQERQKHVAQARQAKTLPTDTLDAVMTAALRSQAACQAIELE
jgi:hypothetical protein